MKGPECYTWRLDFILWEFGKPLTDLFQISKRFVVCKVKTRLEESTIEKGKWLGSYFSRDERLTSY